jgi:Zn-dependent protease
VRRAQSTRKRREEHLPASDINEAELCCAGCGYRSATSAFFRREKNGALGIKRDFCAACEPYAPTKAELAAYLDTSCLVPTGSLILAFGDDGMARIGYFFLFLGLVGLSGIITAVAHEVGHAAAARLVGMRVVAITIGTGPILASRLWQNIIIEMRTFLLTGGMTLAYHQLRNPGKWRQAIVLVGGILGNLVVLALVVLLLALLLAVQRSVNPVIVTAGYAVITGQLLTILVNLFPVSFRIGPSDGKQLVELVWSKNFREQQLINRLALEGAALLAAQRHEQALADCEKACELYPTHGLLLSMLIHVAGEAKGSRAALEYYRERAPALALGTEEERAGAAWAWLNTAWHALLCADNDLLPLADELSKRAVAALPDMPLVQGTRGAVLVELGTYEVGLDLLIAAVRAIESKDDRLSFVPFLAKGERARGNFDMALEFDGFGRHLRAAGSMPA